METLDKQTMLIIIMMTELRENMKQKKTPKHINYFREKNNNNNQPNNKKDIIIFYDRIFFFVSNIRSRSRIQKQTP